MPSKYGLKYATKKSHLSNPIILNGHIVLNGDKLVMTKDYMTTCEYMYVCMFLKGQPIQMLHIHMQEPKEKRNVWVY